MTLLMQISDTHFGTERAPVVEALVRLAHALRPDVLVLSGDITQRATSAQFRTALAFIERLEVPVRVVIPGNHDIPLYNPWLRIVAPYARHCHCFGGSLEPELDSSDLLLMALNTTRWYRHVDGAVSRRQVERVAGRLSRARPEQVRIVVTHQPVSVTRCDDEYNLLHGHAAAVHRWAEAGADLVLGGHIHLPFLRPLHEHVTGLARPMWAVQAGTAVSSRVRHEAGNSVNLIRIGPGAGSVASCPTTGDPRTALRHSQVERWDYQAAADAFLAVDSQRLLHGELPAVR